jgi:hypothetical protein
LALLKLIDALSGIGRCMRLIVDIALRTSMRIDLTAWSEALCQCAAP